MEVISIEALKKSSHFRDNIRWEVTPRIFIDPRSAARDEAGKEVDVTHGYMLYVDLVDDRPVVFVMELKPVMSKTAGYLDRVPQDLVREAMNCPEGDCVSGMYPLTEELKSWLRKELDLS